MIHVMTPEEKSLLERTYKLVEENNGLLHKIRRAGRFATITRIAYWVIIISLSLGAYYLIQPYIEAVSGLYGDIGNVGNTSMNSIQNTTNLFRDILN